MGNANNSCGITSCCLGLFLGVIAAVVVGLLFFVGLFPAIIFGVIIALVLAVVALILLFAGAYLSETNPTYSLSKCLCRHYICYLVGIIGTIVSATVALSIILFPGSIAAAVIVAIVTFFFTLMVTETVGFLACFICRRRCGDND